MIQPADKARLYAKVFRPGDVLGFSNRGCTGIVINLTTWGIPRWGLSHVALVGRHPDTGEPVLWESLALIDRPCLIQKKVTTGLQVQPIRERVERYNGRVWHYRLTNRLTEDEQDQLAEYCQRFLGTNYDHVAAFRARGLTCLERWVFRPEDLKAMYCGEWMITAHRYVNRIQGVNASRMNPNRGVRIELKMNVLQQPTRLR